MTLEYLFDRQRLVRVVLVYTPSNSLSLFVQDSLKSRYNISKDSVRTINVKKELTQTREIYNVVPFLSDRWLFHVPKADKLIKKDFIKLMQENTTGIYVLEFENYRNYKAVKDMVSKQQGVLDLYLAWLRRVDFDVLYNRLVLAEKGFKMPKVMEDFVARGYSNEIESLFELFKQLREGVEVKTRKDVIEICGLSSNTIDSFMFGLLKDPTLSDKGLKKYISNRLKEAVDLAEKYTWSKFRNYLKRSVKSCIDVKMILSSGEVYDNIRTYENDHYEMDKLKRYQRYLPKIKETSMTRLLGLLDCLENRRWGNDLDFLTFFFEYIIYKYESNIEVKELILKTLKEGKSSTSNKQKRTRSNIKEKKVTEKEITKLEEERESTRSVFEQRLKDFGGI